MAIENAKKLTTRIILKNDDVARWGESTLVLEKGEVALAEVTSSVNGVMTPTYMIKVGDGTNTFANLNWIAAQASDVFEWAKQSQIHVEGNDTAEGTVVTSITWDGTINNGKGGLKVTTAKFATSEGFEALAKDVETLTNDFNTFTTTTFEEFKTANTAAIATAKSEAIATAAEDATTKANAAQAAVQTALQNEINRATSEESRIEGLVTTEAQRATGVEEGLEDRIETMEAFWKAAQADGTDTNVIDTLKEIQDYIASDESGAAAMLASIQANTKAIEDQATSDAKTYETKEDASEKLEEAKEYANGVLERLPVATTETAGIVKAGEFINVTEDGTINVVNSYTETKKITVTVDESDMYLAHAAEPIPESWGDSVYIRWMESSPDGMEEMSTPARVLSGRTSLEIQGSVSSTFDLYVRNTVSKTLVDLSNYDNKDEVNTKISNAVAELDSSVAATAETDNKVSVLTGVTQTDGKLTEKTEVTLAAIAKTGSTDDLIQGSMVLVFDCGTSAN